MDLKAPTDVRRAGRKLLAELATYLDANELDPDVPELAILMNIARREDRLSDIRTHLAKLTPEDPQWGTLTSLELRLTTNQRLDLSAVLPVGALGEDDKPVSLNSRRAARAGKTKWVREAERQRGAGWAG